MCFCNFAGAHSQETREDTFEAAPGVIDRPTDPAISAQIFVVVDGRKEVKGYMQSGMTCKQQSARKIALAG